jgi:hypothetical protein
MVRKPTVDAIKRCVCSKNIPPTHFETGNRNMLYPKVVGQSGTASPTPLLVTIPPLQMRNNVATALNHAKRLNHIVDVVGSVRLIPFSPSPIELTADYADLVDQKIN